MNWKWYWIQGIVCLFLGIGAWIDLKQRALPVVFLGSFGVVGVVLNSAWNYQSLMQMLLGCAFGAVFLIIGKFTKEAIGYGDGLGMMVLGIFYGIMRVQSVVFGAFLLSGIYGMWKKYVRKALDVDTIPFFPFLFAAALGGIVL